jgi:hypothetical protein
MVLRSERRSGTRRRGRRGRRGDRCARGRGGNGRDGGRRSGRDGRRRDGRRARRRGRARRRRRAFGAFAQRRTPIPGRARVTDRVASDHSAVSPRRAGAGGGPRGAEITRVRLPFVTSAPWLDSDDGAQLSRRVPAGDGAGRTFAVGVERPLALQTLRPVRCVKLRDYLTSEVRRSERRAGLGDPRGTTTRDRPE